MASNIDYTKIENYQSLECPVCDNLTKPWRLTKGIDVLHRCSNKNQHAESDPIVVWKINPNGEMVW